MDGLEESGLVLVTALPMCSITGSITARDPTARQKPEQAGHRHTARSLWSAIGSTAMTRRSTRWPRGSSLDASLRRPRTVAVVGHLMDRNEGDHLANIAEMQRMLQSLSLETVSVWLSGQDCSDLRRVEEADIIVSLPYGRAAARRLAKRTGARLVETELPFGLPKTVRFMRDVGAAAGKDREAEAFIDAELSRVVPRLKWIIPQYFLNRRTGFMGDPYLLGGFRDIAEDLGMKVEGGHRPRSQRARRRIGGRRRAL